MKESPVKKTTYHRKGFGLKDQIELELKNVYESELIAALRNSGNVLTRNGVTVRLAQAFGFCWGVDRAVSMAYETRRHFPERKIWITNEIIHNPLVNKHLREMDIQFIETDALGQKNLNLIGEGDVVILPAFGASVKEMALIEDRRCEIVDTTCPWVSRVWGRVMKYEQGDFTAVIHGKPNHEETVATSSRAKNYLIVRNLDEAQWVSDYILRGGSKEDFQVRFSSAISPGFDPEEHLMRIGVANQTTMLKGETEQIGRLFQDTMLKKYGPTKLDEHFLSPGDTICDATQERQDAMLDLVGEKLDLILVIGGFNSSNTGHLQEISEHKGLRSYHIDGPDCLGPGNRIKYKPLTVNAGQTLDADGLMAEDNFLPAGELVVGVTAGASTPDLVVAEVLERLFNLPR